MNYHPIIREICGRYDEPGDDLAFCVLAGEKNHIVKDRAESLARWLETEADSVWGHDPRHKGIATAIRAAIAAAESTPPP